MKKKTFFYITIGIFTFLIGLGVVSYVIFRPVYDLSTSKNTCQKCLDVANIENLETVTLSDFANNKTPYGKKVRTKTRLGHDAGYLYFTDNQQNGLRLPVGFDKNTISCVDTEKTFSVCTGYKNWYDGSVDLIVVGYLGKIDGEINKLQSGKEGFNIVCIEQINATDEELKRGKEAFENDPFSLYGILFGK